MIHSNHSNFLSQVLRNNRGKKKKKEKIYKEVTPLVTVSTVSKVNWGMVEYRKTHPLHIAVVKIRNSKHTICLDIEAPTKEDALEKIDAKTFEFKEWW